MIAAGWDHTRNASGSPQLLQPQTPPDRQADPRPGARW